MPNKPTSALIPKPYPLLVDCLEKGAEYGWNRAHKHTDNPGENSIRDQIVQAQLNEICEAFDIVQPEDPETQEDEFRTRFTEFMDTWAKDNDPGTRAETEARLRARNPAPLSPDFAERVAKAVVEDPPNFLWCMPISCTFVCDACHEAHSLRPKEDLDREQAFRVNRGECEFCHRYFDLVVTTTKSTPE